MDSMRLASLQVGKPAEHVASDGRRWVSSIVKDLVDGAVGIRVEGPAGNIQADLKHHGGRDKAVCCFPLHHYAFFSERLGRTLPPGAFGENFTVEGMTESSVCLGDRYELENIVVEVSQPRQPCSNLAYRWDCPSLPRWMVESGTTGWYFRVIREGMVAAPCDIRLLDRPHPDWTVDRMNEVMFRSKRSRPLLESMLSLQELSEAWKSDIRKALG